MGDLFGIVAISEDSVRNSVDPGLVSFDQLASGYLVAGLHLLHQVAFARVRLPHRCFTCFYARFN
jgi:hypothetical protein